MYNPCMDKNIHEVQTEILRALLFKKSARFSELNTKKMQEITDEQIKRAKEKEKILLFFAEHNISKVQFFSTEPVFIVFF